MIITEISVQKRNKKRCNVYVDGNFYCAFDAFTIVANGLKVGMEISEEKLESIAFESEKESAKNYAFDYVSKYFKTEKQVKEKLYQKGYLPVVVNYALSKVKEYGFINDDNYAKEYVEHGKSKKGGKLLKYELKSKGVSEDIIGSIEVDDEEEVEACVKIAQKFFQSAEKSKENVQKLYAKMARRGFSFDNIKKAVSKVLDGEVEEDDFYD